MTESKMEIKAKKGILLNMKSYKIQTNKEEPNLRKFYFKSLIDLESSLKIRQANLPILISDLAINSKRSTRRSLSSVMMFTFHRILRRRIESTICMCRIMRLKVVRTRTKKSNTRMITKVSLCSRFIEQMITSNICILETQFGWTISRRVRY
jgi:hypothetical protein